MREARGSRRTPLVRPVIITDEAPPKAGPHDVPPERMHNPYQCFRCGRTYDGGHVEVTARYADCSVWNCPHCGATHDSRPAWSGIAGQRMGYTDLRAAEDMRRRMARERGWG